MTRGEQFAGLSVAIVTPFKAGGEIDFETGDHAKRDPQYDFAGAEGL